MGFENIFNEKKNKKNEHPMSNPEYMLDINNKQGISYNKFKSNRQQKYLTKNKNLIEGFSQSITSKEKNINDLNTLKTLQSQMDSVLSTLNSASSNLLNETKNNLGANNNNEYAIDMGNTSGQSYIGCYADNSDRMIPNYVGVMTTDQCAQRANDLGKTVFGMQDSNGPTGQCFIGDDLDKAKSLGVGYKTEQTWNTNTNNIKQIALGYNGNLKGFSQALDNFDDLPSSGVWSSGSYQSKAGCTFASGAINSVIASYALNCSSGDYTNSATIPNSTDPGNVTKWVADAVEGKDQASVFLEPVSWMGGDVAYGCPKDFSASYKCGSSDKLYSEDIDGEANGKTAQFDCSDKICDLNPFKLVMQDDGNLVIYTSQNTAIWSSKTNGQVGEVEVLEDWVNSPNNLGSTLETGTLMNVNQFLCSPSGKNIALLSSDGNFVIYKSVSGCTLNGDYYYGGSWINAVYTINQNDLSNLGKIGTIKNDSVSLFNSDLLAKPWGTQASNGTEFYLMNGFNINAGDPIGSAQNTTEEKCKSICAGNENCLLFSLKKDGSEANFYGKDCVNTTSQNECLGDIIPTLQNRVLDSDWNLYVKNPYINADKSCSPNTEPTTLSQFDTYGVGPDMTKDSLCGLAAAINDDLNAENSAYEAAVDKAKEILDQMDNLTNQSKEFSKLQPKLRNKLFEQLKTYKEIYDKIKSDEKSESTFQAQYKDSDLQMVADNFQFVMWSVIAIVSIIVTMKLVKKTN